MINMVTIQINAKDVKEVSLPLPQFSTEDIKRYFAIDGVTDYSIKEIVE